MNISYPKYDTVSFNVPDLPTLRSIDSSDILDGMIAFVGGQTTLNDGIGGIYAWSASSTEVHDGLDYIKPSDSDVGRWKRIIAPPNEVEMRAEIATKADATDYINAAAIPAAVIDFGKATDLETGVTYYHTTNDESGNSDAIESTETSGTYWVQPKTNAIGWLRNTTGSITRSLTSKLFGYVDVEDFGAVGDGVVNDTTAWQNAINYAQTHKLTVRAMSPTYLVGQLSLTGSGYKLDTRGSLFQQVAGIGGDHPVFSVNGSDITIGDLSIRGNIATDTDEYCHAIQITSSKDIKVGVVTGTNIRGDVVYIYGRSSSEPEMSRNIKIDGVIGNNVLRCIFASAGGQGEVGFIRATGGVGYRDVDLEPNDSDDNDYQPCNWKIGHVFGSRVQIVSADLTIQNEYARFGTLDLSGARIINSSPSYVGHGGSTDFAIAVDDCQNFHADYIKIRNYVGVPIKLGKKIGKFGFGTLDFASVGTSETTYKSVILHLGTDATAIVTGDLVRGTLVSNSNFIFRSDQSTLNIDIKRIEVTGGLFGARLTGRVGTMTLDCGNASGEIIFNSCNNMEIGKSTITNSGSAYGFITSSNLLLKNWTATFSAIDYSGSSNIVAVNSSINGSTADGINMLVGGNIRVSGTKVLGSQGAAVSDAAAATYVAPVGGSVIDTEVRTALAKIAVDVASLRTSNNNVLARIRSHGIIAS